LLINYCDVADFSTHGDDNLATHYTISNTEAHNFEMARHIDKQLTDVSSLINVLETVPNLGQHPTWF